MATTAPIESMGFHIINPFGFAKDIIASLARARNLGVTVISQPPMSDDDLWRTDKAFNINTLDEAVSAFLEKQSQKL